MNNNTIKYKNTNNDLEDIFPKNWNCKRIKQIFYEIDERSTSGKEDLLSVSQYTGVTLRKESREDQEFLTNAKSLKNYKIVKENDLIINIMLAWNGSLGISKYYGITSPAYCIYRTYDNFDPNFFGYLFSTNLYKNEFKKNSYGIIDSRLRMYSNNFFNITAFYPSLREQKEIVNFLDKKCEQINQFIADKKQLINLLKEQRQSVINSHVNESENDDSNNWVTHKLKHISDIKFSNVDKLTHKGEVKVKLCNYVDVYKNDYITNNIDFMLATATLEEIEKFKVIKGDIIITKDSESADDIGIPAFVSEDIENLVCAYHLAMIRANQEIILDEFLFRKIESKEVNSQFEVNATGVTRVGLSIADISNVLISYPKDIKVQKEIISKIKSETKTIDETIFKTEEELRLVAEYKEALISNAVTGQLHIA